LARREGGKAELQTKARKWKDHRDDCETSDDQVPAKGRSRFYHKTGREMK
jgi:hypothetical protein